MNETCTEVTKWEGRRRGALSDGGQYGLQPCRQRSRPERLGEEVVRAQLEHSHLVVFVALGGEDDEGMSGRWARAQWDSTP